MKVGDLVQSKHPRIFGSGFGVIVAIRHPPSLLGGKRAPKYNVHWAENGQTSLSIPAIELEKVA